MRVQSDEDDYDDDAPDDSGADDASIDDPDPRDVNAADGMVACNSCRRRIFEDAEKCPHCGQWQVESEDAPAKRNWVVITAVILLVIVVVFWVLAGMLKL